MGLPFASVPVPLNRPSVWSAFAACTASSLAANAEGTNETARVSARMKDKTVSYYTFLFFVKSTLSRKQCPLNAV